MRDENRSLRQQQIEAAAYALLEERGYAGTSMQGIARRARASNETLYNWYGDKQGLFRALVTRNAAEVKTILEANLPCEESTSSILPLLGPKLLELLLGNRAIALNRAAAADSTGELGAAISQAGRDTIMPLLEQVLKNAASDGQLSFERSDEAAGLFLDLLVGDLQIRRVIGRMQEPNWEYCQKRAKTALQRFLLLLERTSQ